MRIKRTRNNPTDLQLLDAIYNRYYGEFVSYDEDPSVRSTKNYVPVDVKEIGNELGIDVDIVFGRLYYDLEGRHGYSQDNGSRVHFFAMRVGADNHCVHFPYLASVLAGLSQEDRKFRIATIVAFCSFIVAATALVLSISF